MKKAGIYIHIPFCTVKCIYCDFYSITEREDSMHRFINAIIKEIKMCNSDVSEWTFDTIFIGGGTPSLLNGEKIESQIRGMEVSNCVSQVSAIPQVREMLVAQQQLMGKKKAVVMDGRDIGSVVFPNAELKVFMTASIDIRAQRRYDEFLKKGIQIDLKQIKLNLSERDYIDSHRDTAPLVQTHDALILDNSHLTQKEQLDWVLEKVKQITSNLE